VAERSRSPKRNQVPTRGEEASPEAASSSGEPPAHWLRAVHALKAGRPAGQVEHVHVHRSASPRLSRPPRPPAPPAGPRRGPPAPEAPARQRRALRSDTPAETERGPLGPASRSEERERAEGERAAPAEPHVSPSELSMRERRAPSPPVAGRIDQPGARAAEQPGASALVAARVKDAPEPRPGQSVATRARDMVDPRPGQVLADQVKGASDPRPDQAVATRARDIPGPQPDQAVAARARVAPAPRPGQPAAAREEEAPAPRPEQAVAALVAPVDPRERSAAAHPQREEPMQRGERAPVPDRGVASFPPRHEAEAPALPALAPHGASAPRDGRGRAPLELHSRRQVARSVAPVMPREALAAAPPWRDEPVAEREAGPGSPLQASLPAPPRLSWPEPVEGSMPAAWTPPMDSSMPAGSLRGGPWPELPAPPPLEPAEGAALLLQWERLSRLDREQRGE
jgi:hypothetical protein